MSAVSPPPRVFLTGASSGIGLAIARELTSAGCEVWGTSRQLDRLPTDLPRFHPVQLSLNDPVGLRSAFRTARTEAGGSFDVLINNAGDAWFGPAADLPPEGLHNQFQTLAFGPFTLVQLALPDMRQSGSGLIVNVTSIAARLHLPYAAAYNAGKAALSVLTATLRIEEADLGSGVQFVDVQPGDIRTGFNQSMTRVASLDLPPSRQSLAAIAARRTLTASDRDIAAAPPPSAVAAVVRRLVLRRARSLPAVVTVGMFSQARLGPLAARFLPTRLLHWTIRQHFGLRSPRAGGVPRGTNA